MKVLMTLAHSWRHLPAGILVTATLVACAAPQPTFDRQLGLESFDAAWRIVYETHFDTTFHGVDWPALREELRPAAANATTQEALRGVIRDMLGRLGQSHFGLIPQELADTLDPERGDEGLDHVGDLGIDVRLLGADVVVTRVDSTGPAWAAGVRPGWIVQSVEDESMSDLLETLNAHESRYSVATRLWNRVTRQLVGRAGTARRLAFLDRLDRKVSLELTLRRDPSVPVKLGNLPTFFVRMTQRRIDASRAGVSVGYIWFNAWMVPLVSPIDSAIDEFRGFDGMIIDLRGNRGGVGAMVMGLAGHFSDQRVTLGTFRTRTTTLRHVANPRRVSTSGHRVTPFAGPVAILVDGTSGSASETFAGGMQSVGRSRVFGERTMGGVLPAMMDRLPNGDVLYHAFAEFQTATGVTLEGRGVIPDEPVAVTRGDFIDNRDPVLHAAIEWIAAQHGAAGACITDGATCKP